MDELIAAYLEAVNRAIDEAVKKKNADLLLNEQIIDVLASLDNLNRARLLARVRSELRGIVSIRDLDRLITEHHRRVRSQNREAARREIQVNQRSVAEVINEICDVIGELNNEKPTLFLRGGQVVTIHKDENGSAVITVVTVDVLHSWLAQRVDFVRATQDGVVWGDISERLLRTVLADPEKLGLPPLEAVSELPVFRADGTLITNEGHDQDTRVYYCPTPGTRLPKIVKKPGEKDVIKAIKTIEEVLADFPFVDRASWANAFALLLTPIIRHSVPSNVPLALIDAPQAGTGKSLLAEIVSVIATGTVSGITTMPRDDEELRKVIYSMLSRGTQVIIFDNVIRQIRSGDFSSVLTSRTWAGRPLGRTEFVPLPQRATWIATGNNIRVGGDMQRRCYWIRLDAQMARPWTRTKFRHKYLIEYVREQRGRIIAALVTMVRYWYLVGQPEGAVEKLGNFESWCETVGGVLTACGVDEFLGNAELMYSKVDQETTEWEAFLLRWYEVIHQPITVSKLVRYLRIEQEQDKNDDQVLINVLPNEIADPILSGKSNASVRLGRAFQKREKTRFTPYGLYLEKIGSYGNAVLWKISCDHPDLLEKDLRIRRRKGEDSQNLFSVDEPPF